MTIQLKLANISFTGDLPKLQTETMLNSGSLLLVDPANPLNKMDNIGSSIPNLAKKSALSLAGSSVDALSIKTSNLTDKYILELSKKGGIHAAIPATATGKGYFPTIEIDIPNAINDYFNANQNHKYYISQWIRPTRIDANSVRTPFLAITKFDTNYLAVFDKTGDLPTGSNRIGAYKSNSDVVGQSTLRAIGVSAPTVTYSSGFTAQSRIFTMGSANDNWYAKSSGAYPSYILYRVYIEDLTVSGNSYDSVLAKDKALYQQEVLTASGRYYGDTYTDPATIE